MALEHELVRRNVRTQRQLDRLRKPEVPRRGGVAVYNDANLPVGSGSFVALTFNSERKDDADFHSVSANTSRLTVPTGYGGPYIISGHAVFTTSAAGNARFLAIRLNGTTYIASARFPFGASEATHMSVGTPYDLDATDYVELMAWQDTGGSLNVLVLGNYSPEFRMEKIR